MYSLSLDVFVRKRAFSFGLMFPSTGATGGVIQVYAYTNSKLQVGLLRLFVDIEVRNHLMRF